MKKLFIQATLIIVFFALSSCSGVSKLTEAQLNLPDELAGNSLDSTTIADIDWWALYSDSVLVSIIDETLQHNRDLMAAGARVEQMRELYGLSKANFLPNINGNAMYNRETNDYYGEKHITDPQIDLKATMSWEIDLWGGLAWARKKGAADFAASVENQRAMRLTLIAEAASAYYRLLALDNELSIVRQTLFTRKENLQKAKLRFEGGLTPETVYQQAQVECATTEALIPGLERQIEAQKNAITLLMGRYPSDEIRRGKIDLEETFPDRIPVGLPSTLLERRPDIRAAEAALKSSLANVGITYANRFPKLRIDLTGGLENNEFSHFFESPFTFVLGQISGSILDFGRNKRKYRASIAAYEQSRYAYEQKVLTAFKEVDDAAVAYRLLKETTERRQELLEAAQRYAELARAQYNMGVINYIDVLDAQRRYFDAQVGLNNAVRDEHLAIINLYKSVGGGW
ncbi:MAG: TolC family protein [Muribaculaceae bacterium]|nr:TolC family protein [Muribaculaceae bacterium]